MAAEYQRGLSEAVAAAQAANSPKSDEFLIEEATRVGELLILRVWYPSCAKCSYEGRKVMVFLNVGELEALRWRVIDPHFRDPKKREPASAPSPAARFPASDEGWADAIAYAQSKVVTRYRGVARASL